MAREPVRVSMAVELGMRCSEDRDRKVLSPRPPETVVGG